MGNHVFILQINSVADLVITFTVTDDFALTPVAEHFYSTFHAAKCRTFQNLPLLPLGPLSVPLPISLFLFFFLNGCLFFLVPASFYHCIFFFFFVRVASLFIDSNTVHFTVWFWGSQEGRGGLHTACRTIRCPVVSLCT